MRKNNFSYDHSPYLPFHQFGKDRWKQSPLRKLQYAWRETLDSLPSDLKEKVLKIYQFKPVQKARDLFNLLEELTCGGINLTKRQ